ncbi:unnamed protein product [Brassica napus]|uniref:(rape) hypothetical protein n=1 Tax=Brassica napus TaxID=3708 RepID=A0A817AXZ5_BRANA|nr:unnamed protein product [Brassica napus]
MFTLFSRVVYISQPCRLHNSAIPQTYPKIRKCLDNSAVSKEETSKKKRRLSAKKRKCQRRLVFAIITDIELVAIYTWRRRPCFSFSDPFLPVSIFTVVATTTACHHTGHLSLFQSLSLFLCILNLFLLLEGG